MSPKLADHAAGWTLVHRPAGDLEIRWRASQPAGVVFRLYRQSGLARPELLYELPSASGQIDYRVGDRVLSGVQTYELRVAKQRGGVGQEVVLGVIEVRVSELAARPATSSSAGHTIPMDVARFAGADPRRGTPRISAGACSVLSFDSEPPEPPPRLVC